MSMDKAIIEIVNGSRSGEVINVLYYPNEYTIEVGNQYASTTIVGLSEPINQFVSGNSETLSMELFFDTYETNEDVRIHTNKVTMLARVDSELHAPPIVKFTWGGSSGGTFKGFMEKVTQKFTMFNESGVPVRAVLNISLKSSKSVKEQFQEIPRNSSDRTKQRVLNQGEHLWMLASREYQDPEQWREIARANNIDNPRILSGGKNIIIPRLR